MPKVKFKEPTLVKIAEAAKILGVHKDTLRRWEKAGKIKVLRHPDGSRLYDISDLAKFDGSTQTPSTTQLLSKSANIPHPLFSSFLKKDDGQPSVPVIPSASEGSSMVNDNIDIFKNLRLFGGFVSLLVILITTIFATRYLPFNKTSEVSKETSEVSSNVLAATAINPTIKMNADLKVSKSLTVADTINGLLLSATSSGIQITDPNSSKTLTITGDNITLDQSFAAGNTPTIEGLNLTASKNQLVLGPSGGITGTLTWTPSTSAKTITLPDATTTLVGTETTQTLKNKTISSSDNTITLSGSFTGITGLGTISTGTWNGTKIGTGYGGTGLTSYTTGDILYSSASNTLSKLAAGTSGQVLSVASGIPSWTTISGSGVTADSLDFTELADSMTLDSNLAISPSSSNYSINIDSNTLYIDTANNRVGIGNSTPDYALKVTDSGYFSNFLGVGSSLSVSGNVGIGKSASITSNLDAGSISTSTLSVSGASNLSTLTTSGNAGIGGSASVTSLTYALGGLRVNGLSDLTGNLGVGSSLTTTGLAVLNGGLNVSGYSNLTGNVGVGASLTITGLGVLNGGLQTTNINASTLTASTSVSTPSLTLTGNNAALTLSGTTPSITSGSNVLGIFAGGNIGIGTTTTLGSLFNINGSSVIGSSFMGGAAPANGLAVQGNVGIGTSAAGAALSVNGGGLFGWGTASISLSSGAILGVNGNVGVGTTSPLGNLHVVGQCVTGDTKLKRRRKRRKTMDDGEMEDGRWEDIRIDQIEPGDEILTLDEKSGEFVASKVHALMDMGRKDITKITTVSGKTIRTTTEHPYLTKEPLSFVFVDETGILNDGNSMMGLGALHFMGNPSKLNRELRDVFLTAINELGQEEKRFEFKFNYVKPTNIHLYRKLLKILAKYQSQWEFTCHFEQRSKGSFWKQYLYLLYNVLQNIPDQFTVLADYLNKPSSAKRDIEVVTKLPQVKNILQVESQGSMMLQVIDILLGAVGFKLAKGKNIYRKEIAKEVEKMLKNKKRAGVSQAYAAQGIGMVTHSTLKRSVPLNLEDVKSSRWIKVKDLQVGVKIATTSGWEEIAKIEHLPREQVFDIEVEGTHNFVGNDIVAHNTYINGSLGIGTAFTGKTTPTNGLAVQGNIGIGTTSPSYPLHVVGNAGIGSSLTITGLTYAQGGLRVNGFSDLTGNVGVGGTATFNSLGVFSGGLVVNGGSSPSQLFQVNTGSNSVVITSSGNIGIGTTSPAYNLDVSGSANITGSLTVSGSIVGTGAVGGWTRDSGNGIIYTSTSTDKIGIGVTGSSSQVEIKANSTNTALTLKGASSGSNNIFDITNPAGTTTYFSINSSGQLSGNAFQLTDAAKAIVGTAVPGAWANIASVSTNDFTYRRAVSVTASSDLAANYEVTLDITTAATANQIYSNTYGQSSPYKDFRLFYTTDSGTTYAEVARNVTNFSSSRVTLTFQLSAAITSGNTSSTNYYLFYSNSSYSSMTTPSTYTGTLNWDSHTEATTGWTNGESTGAYVLSTATSPTSQAGTYSLKTVAMVDRMNTFATTSQTQLSANLYKAAALQTAVGGTDYIYLAGGHNGTTDQSTISKASISSNNIGTWATTGTSQPAVSDASVATVSSVDGGTGADGTLDLSLGSGAGGCNGTGLTWTAGTSTCTIATATKSTFNFTTINVSSGTTLTTDGPKTTSNFVTIKATGNITIAGTINLAGKGYSGGSTGGAGSGPGGGGYHASNGGGGGGGYGGAGGTGGGFNGVQGPYGGAAGSSYSTDDSGSGGGGGDTSYGSSPGGAGGGGIKIVSTGDITVSGTINANGNNGTSNPGGAAGGGGSGGRIYLQGSSVTVSGSLTTNGGTGGTGGGWGGGGGGGGRITLEYSGTLTTAGSTISVTRGTGGTTAGANGNNGSNTTSTISPYFFILGGKTGSSAQTAISKAAVNSDSTIGTFAATTQALPEARYGHTTVTGSNSGTNYIYIIGGHNGTTSVNTVYRATVTSTGDITSAPTTTSQGQLSTAYPSGIYEHATTSLSIGGTTYVYVVGGLSGSTAQTGIYKASLSSGNMGSWSATTTSLPAARYSAQVAAATVGSINYLYIFGGKDSNGTESTTVYRAKLDSSGDITEITATGQATLTEGLSDHTTLSYSSGGSTYFYTLGGHDGTNPNLAVYRSTLTSDETNFSITKTIDASGLNLSNKNDITFSFYSNSTAAVLMEAAFYDTSGGWQTTTFAAAAASTWGSIDWDISGIASTSKDAVTQLRFKINSAQSTEVTSYIDNIQAQTEASGTDTNSAGSSTLGSANLSLNAQGTGIVRINYSDPADTTNFPNLAGSGGMVVYNGSETPLISINSSGNLGIGLTSAPTSLFVVGNAMIGYSSGTPASLANGLAISGNLGIGTTSPSSKLNIIGNVGIGTSAAGAALQVNGGGLFGWGTASVTGPTNGLSINGNLGIGATTTNSNLVVAGNAHIGSLRQGIAAPTDGLFVDGNVGIGATSTAYNLDVWGTARISSALTVGGNIGIGASVNASSAGIFGSLGASSLSISGASTLSTLTTSGNAGIGGSASVASYLSVGSLYSAGPVCLGTDCRTTWPSYTSEATTASNGLTLSTYDVRLGGFLTQATGIDIAGQNFGLLGNVGIGTSANSGARLAVLGGNVGIGTTSPQALFQVNYSSSNPFVITSGGNVGVGTTLPVYPLQVIGNAGIGGTASVTGLTYALGGLRVNGLSDLTGNVGIGGTATLSSALCLGGECKSAWSGSGNYTASNGLTLSGVDFQLGGSLTRATGIDIAGQNFGLLGNVGIGTSANSGARLAVMGGNVGIGTTTANSTLSISGNAHIGSLRQDIAAPTDGLLVDGNVGIGATTSSNKLDVWGNSRIAGTLTLDSTLTAPTALIGYAPGTSLDSGASLAVSGNLGIGTTTPTAPLEVKATGTGVIAKFTSNNITGCTLADGGTITCSSDINLKKNIDEIDYGLDALMSLNPVAFNWRSEADGTSKSLGFIAQEVEQVIPKLVITDPRTGMKELNTIGLVPVLTKSIQELNDKITAISINDEGELIVSKLEAGSIVLDPSIKIASLEERIKSQESRVKSLEDQIATQSAEVNTQLNLTPPDLLLATGSATLANITITSEATVSGMLKAYQAEISDNFKSFGKTTLADTLVAGTLSVDGILSLTGTSLSNLNTLYLQDNPLAQRVDIFSGKVIIDSSGLIKTVSLQTDKLILGIEVLGESAIAAGSGEVTIETKALTEKSKIFITSQSDVEVPLFVTEKLIGKSFKVKTKAPALQDIIFDWMVIESP